MFNGFQEFKIRNQVGKRQKVGCLGQQYVILQKHGHADGTDERRESWRLSQGFIGYFFDGETISGRVNHRYDGSNNENGDLVPPQHG